MSPSEAKVLERIAMNGPATGYDLLKAEGLGLTTNTAYSAPKNLEKKGFLAKRVVGKTKAGLDEKEYDLTVRGIAKSFTLMHEEPRTVGEQEMIKRESMRAYEKDNLRNLDKLAEKWGYRLPMVLGNWDHLKKNISEPELYWKFNSASEDLLSEKSANTGRTIHALFQARPPIDLNDENVFTLLFYDPSTIMMHIENWIKALKGLPEVRELMIEMLPLLSTQYRLLLASFEEMERELKVLP